MRPLTRERAREILEELTVENDGQYAPALLELVNGIYDPSNGIALEVRKDLYLMTDRCVEDMEAFLASSQAAA